ncbi:MAG: hypothetical protein V1911_02770 [Candidatus Micrarchaeota archaeon]
MAEGKARAVLKKFGCRMTGRSLGAFNTSFLVILGVFAFIILLPTLLSSADARIAMIVKFFLMVEVFIFVRMITGGGLLTYVISAILIYILIFRFYELFASVHMLYLIAAMGLSGIIIFGLQKH